ncbi:MAG TPA: hypothetical protein VK590_00395 [Saprospiraceae bacterium]|nr:hypothetical protein [Saprospiraceae bacterium]
MTKTEQFDILSAIAGLRADPISPDDSNYIDLTGRGICLKCQHKVAEALLKKPFPSDLVSEAAAKLMRDRNEILDLFCSAFLSCHGANDLEGMKDLFSRAELECKIDDTLIQTFRVRLREDL